MIDGTKNTTAYNEWLKQRGWIEEVRINPPTGGKAIKTYQTYEQVSDLKPCKKRPIVIHARQIEEPFRVDTLEGDYKRGKSGDYLMCGVNGELYICDKDIFEKTYDFIKE